MNNKVKALLKSLTEEEKRGIYNAVRKQYVKEDIIAWTEGTELMLNEKEADWAADMVVEHGWYDCNCSYWDNLEAIASEAKALPADALMDTLKSYDEGDEDFALSYDPTRIEVKVPGGTLIQG